MLMLAFFKWWYGTGWLSVVGDSAIKVKSLAQSFSILILLRTLFAPWKQLDASGGVNQGMNDQFRHAIDKFVSRFVGFFVRFFTIIAALVLVSLMAILRVLWIMVWPFLPVFVPGLLLYGIGIIG
jgi:hypothetical protein